MTTAAYELAIKLMETVEVYCDEHKIPRPSEQSAELTKSAIGLFAAGAAEIDRRNGRKIKSVPTGVAT